MPPEGGSFSTPTETTAVLKSFVGMVPFQREGQARNRIWLTFEVVGWMDGDAIEGLKMDGETFLAIGGAKETSDHWGCEGVGCDCKIKYGSTNKKICSPQGYAYTDGTFEILHGLYGLSYMTDTTSAIEVVRIRVHSWADADRTRQIDPSSASTLYSLTITPTSALWFPIEECTPDPAMTGATSSFPGLYCDCPQTASPPGFTGCNNKHFYFQIPENWDGDNLVGGETVSLNLCPTLKTYPCWLKKADTGRKVARKPTCAICEEWRNAQARPEEYRCDRVERTEIRECYIVGSPTATRPTNYCPTSHLGTPLSDQPSADDPGAGDGWEPGDFLHPTMIRTESGCDACWGTKDAYQLAEFSHKAFLRAGWTSGISNITFTGVELDTVMLDPDGNTVDSKHVVFNVATRTAYHKEELFALPSGIGTRIIKGDSFRLEAPLSSETDENGNPVEPWVTSHNTWWAINAQIQETLQYMRTFQKTCEFSASKVSPEVQRQADGTYREEDVIYDIEHLNSTQREMFVSKLASQSASFSAGFDINDTVHFVLNMSTSSTSAKSLNDALAESEFESTNTSIGCSVLFDKFLTAIAYDGDDSVTQQKMWEDSLLLDFSFGSMGSSSKRLSEYQTDGDGNLLYDKDTGEKLLGSQTAWSEFQSTFGKFQGMGVNYRLSHMNGFDLSVNTSLTVNADGVIEWGSMLSNAGFTIGYGEKDSARWTFSWSMSGAFSLGVATTKTISSGSGGGTSAYVDLGVVMTPAERGEGTRPEGAQQIAGFNLVPSIKVRGALGGTGFDFLDGLSYSVNFQDGSATVGKHWNYAHQASWLDREEGDKLEIDLSLRATYEPLSGPSFRIGVDADFQKTLLDMGDVIGKLVLTATGTALFTGGGGGTGPFTDPGYTVGLALNASITLQNNVLGWLGLPFNIHPRISAGIACNFHFGAYTKALQGQPRPIDPGVDAMNDSFRYTMVLGVVGYDISMVDQFREHMKRKHDPIIRGIPLIGLLGDCPLLNVVGDNEGVWQYVLRSTPTRALAVCGIAAKECEEDRKKKYVVFYDECKARNMLLPGGTPRCPTKDHWDFVPGQTKHDQPTTKRNAKKNGGRRQCEREDPDGEDPCNQEYDAGSYCSTGYIYYNPEYVALDTNPWKTKSLNNWVSGENGIKDRLGNVRKPGACVMSVDQCVLEAIVRIENEFDPTWDRCRCVRNKFASYLNDAYYQHYWHGSAGKRDDFKSELMESGIGEGVLKAGIDAIDSLVISMVMENRDIINNKKDAEYFGNSLVAAMTSILESTNYDDIKGSGGFDDKVPGRANGYISKQEIINEIKEMWLREDTPIKDFFTGASVGVCTGLKDLLGGAAGLLWKGVGGLFNFVTAGMFTGEDRAPSFVDAQYEARRICGPPVRPIPCSSPGNPPPDPADDDCYEEYINYMYFLQHYEPLVHSYYENISDLRGDYILSMPAWNAGSTMAEPNGGGGADPGSGAPSSNCHVDNQCGDGNLVQGCTNSVNHFVTNRARLLRAYQILRGNNLLAISETFHNILTPSKGPHTDVALDSVDFLESSNQYLLGGLVTRTSWFGCRPMLVTNCARAAVEEEEDYCAYDVFDGGADPVTPDHYYQARFFDKLKAGNDPDFWVTAIGACVFGVGDPPMGNAGVSTADRPFGWIGVQAHTNVLELAKGQRSVLAPWVAKRISRIPVGCLEIWSASKPTGLPNWTNWHAVADAATEICGIITLNGAGTSHGNLVKLWEAAKEVGKAPTYTGNLTDKELESEGWKHVINIVGATQDWLRGAILQKLSTGATLGHMLKNGWVVENSAGNWVIRDDVRLGVTGYGVAPDPLTGPNGEAWPGQVRDRNWAVDEFIKWVYNEHFGEQCDVISTDGVADAAISPSFAWLFQGGKFNAFGNVYNPDGSKNIEGHPERGLVERLMVSLFKNSPKALKPRMDVWFVDYVDDGSPVLRQGSLTDTRRDQTLKDVWVLLGTSSANVAFAAAARSREFDILVRTWTHGSGLGAGADACMLVKILADSSAGGFPLLTGSNFLAKQWQAWFNKWVLGVSGSHPLALTNPRLGMIGGAPGDERSIAATSVGSHPAGKVTGRIPQGVTRAEAEEIRVDEIELKAGNQKGRLDTEKFNPNT